MRYGSFSRWEESEIAKAAANNPPAPDECPHCGAEVKCSTGMVGEEVLYCEEHGLLWEDSADAIRRVI